MNLNDLFETSGRDIRNMDSADQWLARYTYDNIDKTPSIDIINSLLNRYGNLRSLTLYRGLNFRSKEQWDTFIKDFSNNRATLSLNRMTSWSPSENESEQFAITQPSYHADLDTMLSHEKAAGSYERVSGYRGVILKVRINPGEGIDVNRSNLGYESEVILPYGTYTISIHKVLKRFSDQLKDGDTDASNVVLSMNFNKRKNKANEQFLQHVLRFHNKNLSKEAREHLFNLTAPTSSIRFTRTPYNKEVLSGNDPLTSLFSGRIVPSEFPHEWYRLYIEGMFTHSDGLRVVSYARSQVDGLIKIVKRHPDSYWGSGSAWDVAFSIADRKAALTNLIRDTYGKILRELNSREHTNKINSIKGSQRSIYIRQLQKNIAFLINNIERKL